MEGVRITLAGNATEFLLGLANGVIHGFLVTVDDGRWTHCQRMRGARGDRRWPRNTSRSPGAAPGPRLARRLGTTAKYCSWGAGIEQAFTSYYAEDERSFPYSAKCDGLPSPPTPLLVANLRSPAILTLRLPVGGVVRPGLRAPLRRGAKVVAAGAAEPGASGPRADHCHIRNGTSSTSETGLRPFSPSWGRRAVGAAGRDTVE